MVLLQDNGIKNPPFLLRVYDDLATRTNLPDSFAEGRIILLYKKRDTTLAKNYRPITLLNTDYKLLTKTLMRRMTKAVESFVSPSQFGFLPHRQTSDNVMAVNLALALAREHNACGFGIFIYMEKAYDRVAHDWLFRVLERVGFGPMLRGWIVRIYRSADSRISVNNFLSEPVLIVRQGDALSCYLFILALAPLSHAIKSNPNLHSICNGPDGPLKDVEFADDLFLLLSDSTHPVAIEVMFRIYEQSSNAKINKEKSLALRIGSADLSNLPFAPHPADKFVSHLGVPLNSSGLAPESSTWPDILSKMETATATVNKRYLTLRARVFCFSLLVASRGRHIARFIPPRTRTLDQINKLCWRLVWKDKSRGKVARQFCEQSIDEDGLGILDTKLSYQAELLMWIARFENNPDGLWQCLLRQLLEKARIRGTQRDWVDPLTQSATLKQICLPDPWPNILQLWRSLNGGPRYPPSFEEAIRQPVFDNRFLPHPISTKGFSYVRQVRIRTIGDLLRQDDEHWQHPASLLDPTKFCHLREGCLNLRNTFEPWLFLPHSPTPPPRSQCLGIRPTYEDKLFAVARWSTPSLYKYLLRLRPSPDPAHSTMVRDITRKDDHSPSSRALWSLVYQRFTDRKAADLWWLAIHKGLTIGNRLRYIPGATIGSERCPACLELERSQKHLFAECSTTQKAWRLLLQFAELVFEYGPLPRVDLSWRNVMRGLPEAPYAAGGFRKPWYTMVALMLRSIWLNSVDNIFRAVPLSVQSIWIRFRADMLRTLAAVRFTYKCNPRMHRGIAKTWGLRNRLISCVDPARPSYSHVNGWLDVIESSVLF